MFIESDGSVSFKELKQRLFVDPSRQMTVVYSKVSNFTESGSRI